MWEPLASYFVAAQVEAGSLHNSSDKTFPTNKLMWLHKKQIDAAAELQDHMRIVLIVTTDLMTKQQALITMFLLLRTGHGLSR